MSATDYLQIVIYRSVLLLPVKPLGAFMAAVYDGGINWAREDWLYRAAGIDPQAWMSWRGYAMAFLHFNAAGLLLVYRHLASSAP
jgi:K+-transporting ATPase ATPase A chain